LTCGWAGRAVIKTTGLQMNTTTSLAMNLRILAAAALLHYFFVGCASSAVQAYKKSSTISIPRDKARMTRDEIDRYETHEVYFKLDKAVDSIKIGITAVFVADIAGTKESRVTYFIVDKIIDVKKLRNADVRRIYSEIGRNFDLDWNAKKEIVITSERGSPFKALDEDSVCRIRYTTFSRENFVYTITIDADCGVTFMDGTR
jgi:hypothetical protein